jgi:hypothetical protein
MQYCSRPGGFGKAIYQNPIGFFPEFGIIHEK